MSLVADVTAWPLLVSLVVFAVCAVVIAVFGVRMTNVARALAIETGMGEALMGAVFIGGSTSLSGIVASVTAAAHGHAELAVSNALGGIAAQTVFLAVADMFYRKANLEHAAASAENLMMAAFLVTLLAIPLLAYATPGIAVGGIHPATLLLIAGYLFGIQVLARTHEMPMWLPRRTRETRIEPRPEESRGRRRGNRLWVDFGFCAVVVGVAGWMLANAGISIAGRTGLSEGLVGGVFTAVSTSLPELVIAVTAVRLRALNLAVGDIIGGNAFDTLFLAFSDVAYRKGSIYADVTRTELFWLALTLVMSGVLLMGLLYRERRGIGNIGLESVLLVVLYLGGLAYLAI